MNPQEETFISNFKSRRSPWHYEFNNSYFINNFTACKWYEQVGHIRQRKILKLLLQRFVINATPTNLGYLSIHQKLGHNCIKIDRETVGDVCKL